MVSKPEISWAPLGGEVEQSEHAWESQAVHPAGEWTGADAGLEAQAQGVGVAAEGGPGLKNEAICY